jgi:hypothetical protein
MKTKMIKRLSLLLAMIMMLGACLTSCAVKPIKSTEEEAKIVGKIGKYEVRYDELRYIVLNHKLDMALEFGENIWTEKPDEYEAELIKRVNDTIVSDYYALQAMADYYYVGGGAEGMMNEQPILDAVQETVELAVDEAGSKKKYKKMLADQYLTDHLFRFYCSLEECATELFYILSQDLGIIDGSEEYINEYMHSGKFIRTNHIFLKGLTEENLVLANQLHEQIAAADSDTREFELIMLKGLHCSDYTMTTRHGRYFARYTSDYGDEYELAAFELGVGSLSDVIKTPEGYYIILRLELEEDYLKENYEEFRADIMGSEFNRNLAGFKEDLVFEPNDFGKTIKYLEIE